MNKKITLVFTLLCMLLSAPFAIRSQGLYSEDESYSEDDLTISSNNDDNYTGSLRDEKPDKPGGPLPGTPVGEGLVIMSVLAGGYAFVKKRSSKKENSL